MKGSLITLEGISGTGKTFYKKKLQEEFKDNESVVFIKEIFDEVHEGLSKKIFSALRHTGDRFFNMGVPLTETFLLLAGSMYKYESVVRKMLEEGKIVIEDRGIDTVAVYQALLISAQTGEDPLKCSSDILNFISKFRALPDTTFLLERDVETSIRRAEIRDDNPYTEEQVEYLKTVDSLYSAYADRHQDRIVRLDLEKETEVDIFDKMKEVIDEKLQEEIIEVE
ncbi:MAG: hypothetical protein A2Y24_04455 [Clostridiales bacterium GWE2_32_10]|nr:MAG: hypothetical protein A2Y24_04455 [Clostridiales bacterium GWE2_32_10]HBY20912.1 hypothetical protein [Clostridiales bacterium]